MPQIFNRTINAISRLTLFGGIFAVGIVTWGWAELITSRYFTEEKIPVEQPVPFSHRHHVSGLGIDCRYCHTTVEVSPFAGIPPTATCMNCHKQVWSTSNMLEPVRASLRENRPIQWQRVNSIPDFVYFDHSIHVNKGVGCETCHGRVDEMPLTWKEHSLFMSWCLACHRNPEKHLRPVDQVFTMGWKPPIDQETLGRQLMQQYNIEPTFKLTNCSICHR
jgi:hypothetical protein